MLSTTALHKSRTENSDHTVVVGVCDTMGRSEGALYSVGYVSKL